MLYNKYNINSNDPNINSLQQFQLIYFKATVDFSFQDAVTDHRHMYHPYKKKVTQSLAFTNIYYYHEICISPIYIMPNEVEYF